MSLKVSIFLEKLQHNFLQLHSLCTPHVKICPSLKANAYGHGLVECAKALLQLCENSIKVKNSFYGIGLSRVGEIFSLRNAGISTRVVLYSHLSYDKLVELFSSKSSNFSSFYKNVDFFVDSISYLQDICALADKYGENAPIRIHLKCDTGMGRLGAMPDDFVNLYHYAKTLKNIDVVGICTHFSDSLDHATVEAQKRCFQEVLLHVPKNIRNTLMVHCANSGAILWNASTHYNMSRPGIALYGVSPNSNGELPMSISLQPTMTVHAPIACVKKIPKNHGISYLSTYRPTTDTHIAIINAGYGDGLPIALSNCGQVSIRGKLYPIVGRICMDMCMVDIGSNIHGISEKDNALFWGDTTLSVNKQAEKAGLIAYELLCFIGNNCRIEKIFVD